MTAERFEVQRHVAAPPHVVFDLLREPSGHVAIDSSGMLQLAEGDKVQQVGDRFIVHMDREARNDYPMGAYDVTVIIAKYEQNSLIEWTISGTVQPPMRHLYGYRIDPVDEGSLVTSYYDWSQIEEQYSGLGIFPVIPEASLRATLGILARTVKRVSTSSPPLDNVLGQTLPVCTGGQRSAVAVPDPRFRRHQECRLTQLGRGARKTAPSLDLS